MIHLVHAPNIIGPELKLPGEYRGADRNFYASIGEDCCGATIAPWTPIYWASAHAWAGRERRRRGGVLAGRSSAAGIPARGAAALDDLLRQPDASIGRDRR